MTGGIMMMSRSCLFAFLFVSCVDGGTPTRHSNPIKEPCVVVTPEATPTPFPKLVKGDSKASVLKKWGDPIGVEGQVWQYADAYSRRGYDRDCTISFKNNVLDSFDKVCDTKNLDLTSF